ncbi:hydrogenase expression/formation protein HypE [Candidatus Altiarchaeota archaeon]
MDDVLTLAHGAGGKEMNELISSLGLSFRGGWTGCDDDAASYDLGDGRYLVFTTDSYTVDPIFFPGGDIGTLAVCGTINDLSVMGATPLGISLSLVIEEGFGRKDLGRIMESVKSVSMGASVPVVTGDTKVMGSGKLDKIIINTSGVGVTGDSGLLDKKIMPGDKVLLSGGLGEHAVALLSKRFDYETDIVTDSKPLNEEMSSVRDFVKIAKDPTRGGLSSALNEWVGKWGVGIELIEDEIPVKDQVLTVVDMLGIDLYDLASEGRLVCACDPGQAEQVLKNLKDFNEDAAVIGEVVEGDKLVMKTFLGKRVMPEPTGRIVPRIC